MLLCEKTLQYVKINQSSGEVAVIILCGGSSTRLGKDKLLLQLGEQTVFEKTLAAFENNNSVKSIVVVANSLNIVTIKNLAQAKSKKCVSFVIGGASREESVLNGFNALPETTDVVLVHDGARPFVTDCCIERVIDGVEKHCVAAPGVKVKDTIKVVNNDNEVLETLDRNSLVAMQTPQGFLKSVFSDAVSKVENIARFFDDCSLLEEAGYSVNIVEGDNQNIKITTVDDVAYAEFLLHKGFVK